ncbi:hypothetical protein CDD81_15 [Ophiocordyceps australis]|uniref:AMP-activated protein kinase glycogen-binding domain-containing protein n=1 Tax=Ophiocordyceps australis TaxID=1399860 RepID=A0A2C5YI68_9HYPO|nr:hypothetical protein CDD81_15 [Ophiocordyceps australis]
MGSSHTFTWEHEAEEAYVTGTFDDWSKSVKLEKHNGVFQKTVHLEDVSQKIYYKFVVDNSWTINQSSPHEPDTQGNVNNYLTPQDLAQPSPFISSVSPDATTVAMAGKKNKQKKQAAKASQDSLGAPAEATAAAAAAAAMAGSSAGVAAPAASHPSKEGTSTPSDLPGGFPVTPANEDKTFGVNPLPAAPGAVNPIQLAPGEKIPDSAKSQGLNDNVKLDKASYEKSDALPGAGASGDKTFGVSPLPAAPGAVNPIKLAPGEKIPDSARSQGINDNVKLDKDSYQRSDALPGASEADKTFAVNPLPAAPGAVNPIRLAPGEKIPDSIKSQGLNDNVKLDKSSYEKSDALPGIPDTTSLPPVSKNMIPESSLPIVDAKDAAFINSVGPQSTTVGLAGQVPKESSKNAFINTVGPEATTVGLAGKVPKESSKNAFTNTVGPDATTVGLAGKVPKESSNVPQMVTESQKKAGVSPEASGVPAEVLEKSQVEDELMHKVNKAPVTSEGDFGSGAAKGKTAAAVGGAAGAAAGAGGALAGQGSKQSSTVPQVVKDSQKKAGVSPEASGVPEEVKEKSEVEDELTHRIKKAPATSQGTSGFGSEKNEKTGLIAGAAAAGGGAVVAAAIAAKDAFSEKAGPALSDVGTAVTDTANRNLPDSVKKSLPESAQGMLAGETKNDPRNKVSPEVPSEVKKSIAESGQSPEAAASTAAVEEKKQVESELLKDIKPAPAAIDSKAPTSGVAAGGAPVGAGPGTPAGAPTGVAKVAPTETATVTPIGSAVSPSSGAATSAPVGSTSGAATDLHSGTSTGAATGGAPIGSSTGAAPGAFAVDATGPSAGAKSATGPTTGALTKDPTRDPTGTTSGIPLGATAGAATGGAAALGSTADSKAVDPSAASESSPLGTTGQGPTADAAQSEVSKATQKAEKAKDETTQGAESKADEAKTKDDKAAKSKASKASKGSKKGNAGPPETAAGLEGANGSETAAAESSSKPADTPTSAEKKKKHRLSSIFSKIKDKLSDKK